MCFCVAAVTTGAPATGAAATGFAISPSVGLADASAATLSPTPNLSLTTTLTLRTKPCYKRSNEVSTGQPGKEAPCTASP